MRDRLPIRVDFLFGMPIEVVIENGFHGPIGVCANVDGAAAFIERLEKDHYLRRIGELDCFASRLLQTAWKGMRR